MALPKSHSWQEAGRRPGGSQRTPQRRGPRRTEPRGGWREVLPQGSFCHIRLQSGVAARRESQTCPKALLSCSPTPSQDVTHSVLTTKPIRVRICLGKSPSVQRLLQNLPCKRHQTERRGSGSPPVGMLCLNLLPEV